jgi:hypothetical protein
VMGPCTTHRLFAAALSRITGQRVLVLGYRLVPEDPSPAGLEDAVAGYRWLLFFWYTEGRNQNQISSLSLSSLSLPVSPSCARRDEQYAEFFEYLRRAV